MNLKLLSTLSMNLIFMSLTASAGEVSLDIESPDMSLVASHARTLGAKHGIDKVLVVYDLDNTLMTTNQDLGGDAWFLWQQSLIENKNLSPELEKVKVANDLGGLVKAWNFVMGVGHMHPVEKTTPEMFNRLQREGYSTLILTSRGPDSRSSTERELKNNGYDTSIKPLASKSNLSNFIADDSNTVSPSCLDWSANKLTKATPASLDRGVFLTAGQNKGAMLRSILCHLGRDFKAVVFVDDTVKHVKRMHEFYDSTSMDLVTIRYSHLDEEVKRFDEGDKAPVISAWERLTTTIRSILPETKSAQ